MRLQVPAKHAYKESVLEPAFHYASDPSLDNLLSLLDGINKVLESEI
jgi:hypothetical protein